MNYHPLVSVIIPVYNSEKYIVQAIESVINQTYKNLEIIVINDGSTDNSFEILQKYKTKVRLYSQENKGASSARNIGLESAKGDYIQFLDADDMLDAGKIESQIILMDRGDLDVLSFGTWIRFSSTLNDKKLCTQKINKDYLVPYKLLIDMWNGKGMIQPGAWLASKQLLLKAGIWNEQLSLNDDGEFFCRVILASKKVIYCEKAVVYYRSELMNSLSKRLNFDSLISLLFSLDCYVSNSVYYSHDIELRKALAINYSNFIYQFHSINTSLCKKAEKSIFKLGFKKIPIVGGRKFRILARVVGFKNALLLKKLLKKG